MVIDSMRLTGKWLKAASLATGEDGLCYRTAIFHDSGEISWLFPNSNTAELISAWLDIAEVCEDKESLEMALRYADRILNDPIRGLYRGSCEDAQGLAWYWPGDGTYTGGYSMRFPAVFHRLYKQTGDERYLAASRDIGRTFLRRLLPSGLSNMVGWCPKKGWILEGSAGCRYVYVVSTFAALFEMTGESVYRDAYEGAVQALLKIQREDGAFFQTYDLRTLEAADPSVKVHFFAYIFNALAEAYAVFQDERLVECARRMTSYLASQFYYRQQLVYCEHPGFSTDLMEANTAVQDNANGLLWLHSVTGENVCLDMAVRLWIQAWLAQVKVEKNGWEGALVRGVRVDFDQESKEEALKMRAEHLRYEPSRVGRCEVWFVANYILVSRRLLPYLKE